MNPYIGHEAQIYGVEEHQLTRGKGKGMYLLEVYNGKGLHMTISLDRCADISRLWYKGKNIGYFSPCGYVAPSYYDSHGDHFLKSFTGGFLTTCGLESVGVPCCDQGEELPMHGSISNTPAQDYYWKQEGNELVIYAEIDDAVLFSRKLKLRRQIRVSLEENKFQINDEILNMGDRREPVEILYHMNIGYPLLDEDSEVSISSEEVWPRDEHAKEDIKNCLRMEKPQAGYRERCYYHQCIKEGQASIYQPKEGMGLRITFDPKQLDCFTQWKMLGIRDYVLGLECGNCYPDGRAVMRKNGTLKFVDPGEKLSYFVTVEMLEGI